MSVAASNWHGDVNSTASSAVYGTAFFDKKQLEST
jgi:threonyl-tRNA synthetase